MHRKRPGPVQVRHILQEVVLPALPVLELPHEVREKPHRDAGIHERDAERLFQDFGDTVRIEVVGLDSPRGILLAVRHRVGKDFAAVIGKDRVVRNPDGYETIRAAVFQSLQAVPAGTT